MNTHEKIALAAVLARRCKANSSFIADMVAKISRAGAALTKLNEDACNRSIPGDEYDRREMRATRTVANALRDLGIHGVSLVSNGDPRGYALFLVFKGEDIREYSNDLGQRGYGIG